VEKRKILFLAIMSFLSLASLSKAIDNAQNIDPGNKSFQGESAESLATLRNNVDTNIQGMSEEVGTFWWGADILGTAEAIKGKVDDLNESFDQEKAAADIREKIQKLEVQIKDLDSLIAEIQDNVSSSVMSEGPQSILRVQVFRESAKAFIEKAKKDLEKNYSKKED
jgi:hypothetical protein